MDERRRATFPLDALHDIFRVVRQALRCRKKSGDSMLRITVPDVRLDIGLVYVERTRTHVHRTVPHFPPTFRKREIWRLSVALVVPERHLEVFCKRILERNGNGKALDRHGGRRIEFKRHHAEAVVIVFLQHDEPHRPAFSLDLSHHAVFLGGHDPGRHGPERFAVHLQLDRSGKDVLAAGIYLIP